MVKNRLAKLQPEIDAAAQDWRAHRLDAGFASREFRVWQLNQDLLWMEKLVPEITYVKSGRGYERIEEKDADGSVRLIPRKFERDMYGRPTWALYRAKLLNELAKLKGDHSATPHLGFNEQTQRLLGQLNTAHGLPPPAPSSGKPIGTPRTEQALDR